MKIYGFFIIDNLRITHIMVVVILKSAYHIKDEDYRMAIIQIKEYIEKANSYKRNLKTTKVTPKSTAEIVKDETAFQKLKIVVRDELSLPFILNSGESILLDFGDHCVGYLNYSLDSYGGLLVCDSPVKLKFSFGEFPYEIVKPESEYKGDLGNGWFQREERLAAMMPYSGRLDRRYSFRYLLIERKDNAFFPIALTDIFAECESAVDINSVASIKIGDELLEKIYNTSIKTLKECEQDVFEDGPKRDRRLWLGDLRLQALTDYKTFKNYDLVKRCLYLLAGYRVESKKVSSCLFPNSPPYIDDMDDWIFIDYCLFYIACLYDYYKSCGDKETVADLYEVALEQVEIMAKSLNDNGDTEYKPFVDWCPDLDKKLSLIGIYLYNLRFFKKITQLLCKDFGWIECEIQRVSNILLKYYNRDNGLFVSESGQVSQHSQIWAVLSGVLPMEENIKLINRVEQLDTEFNMRTPYMMHYYIEALYNCTLSEKAIDKVKAIWGKMLDCGYDCFPEVFNEKNDFESPYNAPEFNSACHAWSCTPAYWIDRYVNGE